MTLKTKIARFILFGLVEVIAITAGIAQETPAGIKNTLPALRTMTTADCRKLEGTIISKDATSIQFRRVNDGKEFMVDGQAFCHDPGATNSLTLTQKSRWVSSDLFTTMTAAPVFPDDKRTVLRILVCHSRTTRSSSRAPRTAIKCCRRMSRAIPLTGYPATHYFP